MKARINKKIIMQMLMISLGVFVGAVGLKLFLIPAKIAPGGVSGLATVIHYLTDMPTGILIFVLNVPLFVIGLKDMGKAFTIKTLYATLLFSVLTDIIDIPQITTDMFLSTVFGGVVFGLGLGIVIKNDATTGGSDMAGKILNKHFQFIGVGTFIFAIDMIVVILVAIVFEPLYSLYSIAALFLSSKVIDIMTDGLRTGKVFFIISDKPEEVGKAIIKDVHRGATMLYGKGMYTMEEKNVIMSVVENSLEAQKIKNSVNKTDPNAFVISTGIKEVLGQGFTQEIIKTEEKEG